jgi:hypothetical protein
MRSYPEDSRACVVRAVRRVDARGDSASLPSRPVVSTRSHGGREQNRCPRRTACRQTRQADQRAPAPERPSSRRRRDRQDAREAVVIRDTPVSAGYILLRNNSTKIPATENQERTQRPAMLPLPPKVNPIAAPMTTRTSKPLPIHQMPKFSVDHVSPRVDQPGRERRFLTAITIRSAEAIATKSASTILIAVLSSNIALSPRFC